MSKCISNTVICQVKAELALDNLVDQIEKNPEKLQDAEIKNKLTILRKNLELLRREVILEKVEDQLALLERKQPCHVTIRLEWEIEELIAKAKKIEEQAF